LKKVFPSRLRELAGEMNTSEFARFLGLRQPTLSRYMKGERTPTVKQLQTICHKCGVTVNWLTGLTDDRSGGKPAVLPPPSPPLSPSPAASAGSSGADPAGSLVGILESNARAIEAHSRALEISARTMEASLETIRSQQALIARLVAGEGRGGKRLPGEGEKG
jgi:hypothetical protein